MSREYFATLRIAVLVLLRNKMRSFFTVLGIIIGEGTKAEVQ